MLRDTIEEQREPLLTPGEVARHLRVDSATVRRWVKDGRLEAIELPSGAYRIKASILDALYERRVQSVGGTEL